MSQPRPAADARETDATHAAGVLASLAQPVDIASLAVFRVMFGLFAAGEAYRLVAAKHVHALWLDTAVFFPWHGFAWLPKLPGNGMYAHFYLLVLLGLAVAGGLWFRGACVLLALGFVYPILLCETAYLSELYLLALLALLLAASPAHGTISADAWLRPRTRRVSAPRFSLLLIRAQLSIVQVCMGLWMLQPDWLRGSPLLLWLPERSGFPLLGRLHQTPPFIVLLSCVLALAFVLCPIALWWRRTRTLAFSLLVPLLVWLEEAFELGAFPWLLLVGNLLFLPPDWPRRIFNWPRAGALEPAPEARVSSSVAVLAAAWLVLQVAVPLRGLMTPGNNSWTEQGLNFSWRVPGMAKAGAVTFSIRNPETEETRTFDPKEELSGWQYGRVAGNPALLQRYALAISQRETAAGAEPVEVRALTLISLNGRQPQRLVDPQVDLVRADPPDWVSGAEWVLPLEIPLEQQWQTDAEWLPPRDDLSRARGRRSQ